MSYQGWKNYETWAVALWLDNEQGTHLESHAIVARCHEDAETHSNVLSGIWTREDAARYSAADALKEYVEDMVPDLGGTLWADLLNAAMGEVDWNELVVHFAPEGATR